MSKLKPIDLTAPSKPRFSVGGNVAQSSVRKIVVKHLKPTPPSVPQQYYQNTYDKLLQSTRAVLREEVITESLESLYRGSENLVRNGQGQMLYDAVQKEVAEYAKTDMKAMLVKQYQGIDADVMGQIMEVMVSVWDKWMSKIRLLCSIFYFLERAYILIEGRRSISNIGSEELYTHVLQDDIGETFNNAILGMLRTERFSTSGDASDSTLVTDAIRIYLSLLPKAKNEFLLFIYGQSVRNYKELANEYHALSPDQYIRQYQRFVKEEQSRLDKYLFTEPGYIHDLMGEVEVLIGNASLEWLIDEGLSTLLDNNDSECLTTLLELDRNGSRPLKLLEKGLNKYIETNGRKIVSNPDNDATMIPSLLAFKKRMDGIIATAFEGDDNLTFALREAFGKFINTRQNKPAEMIAKYLDACLRRGTLGDGSNLDDNALESELDKVLELFRFVEGKDVFEAFYKKDLAKRLLLNKSASADAERSMLTKLKTECGAAFTQKLEGMFKDIDISKDFMGSFKETKFGQECQTGDLYVTVLSQAFWPTYSEVEAVLPTNMSNDLARFEEYYLARQTGRKIMWRHALDHCVLKANFPKGKKELSVSLFQSLILIQFNRAKVITFSQLKDATRLEDGELERTLQSLACGKIRPLSKSPKGREVSHTDSFTINLGFSEKLFRIKINQIQLKETPKEVQDTHDRIIQDRQFEIQACIIRILKSTKTVKHVELMRKVIELTKMRGTLNVGDIKRQIEKYVHLFAINTNTCQAD